MAVTYEKLIEAHQRSREKGTATGLRIKGRKSLLITTITEVSPMPHKVTVTVNTETIYGEFLSSPEISVDDIEEVVPLRIRYNDPFYEYLRELRRNIRSIRENAGLESNPSISGSRHALESVSGQ